MGTSATSMRHHIQRSIARSFPCSNSVNRSAGCLRLTVGDKLDQVLSHYSFPHNWSKSMASNHDQSNDPLPVSSSRQWGMVVRHFLIGVFLSGVPILAGLWLSVDMTDGSWAAVGTVKLGGAIAVPLVVGVLSALWGRQFVQRLSNAIETVNLPF